MNDFLRSSLPDGLLDPRECDFLFRLARQAPEGSLVELGTFKGRGTAILCYEARGRKVYTFDNWVMQHHGKNSRGDVVENMRRLNLFPTIVTALSYVVPQEILNEIGKVSLLVVDSDHQSEILAKELLLWLPLVVAGGIVALHDYGDPKFPTMKPYIDKKFNLSTMIGMEGTLIAFRV